MNKLNKNTKLISPNNITKNSPVILKDSMDDRVYGAKDFLKVIF